MYYVKLNNSILGWMLVPTYRHPTVGVDTILTLLYGQDWLTMKSSERAFLKGEPIEKVIAHIKEVCQSLNIGMSLCGKKGSPTIRLWPRPAPVQVEAEKVNVDLKWSCWMNDKSTWDVLAPGVWEKMEAAFNGGKPIEVNTGPRKEIRYGSVTISKGKATGWFATEWDDLGALADTLNTDANVLQEVVPYSSHNDSIGMDWEVDVRARKFHKLMERIDQAENELLARDKEEWNAISGK